MDDAEILRLIDDTFADCERPKHFVDFPQNLEGQDHDHLLRSRGRTTLTLDDVGTVGCDPISFITTAGYAYFFPTLSRLALIAPDRTRDWYGFSFLFHLTYNDHENRFLRAFTSEQRRAVSELLKHLVETRAELVDREFCSDNLMAAIELWSAKP